MEAKDDLQIYLESVCHVQAWAKRQIAKQRQEVTQINLLSINSVKQKLMKQKQSPLARINRVLKFYESRGQNREFVNRVYRSILKNRINGL